MGGDQQHVNLIKFDVNLKLIVFGTIQNSNYRLTPLKSLDHLLSNGHETDVICILRTKTSGKYDIELYSDSGVEIKEIATTSE